MKKTAIYTLGTSTRNIEEFIKIATAFGIEEIVDVRRFPTSHLPHFKKENLEKYLKASKLGYSYLGKELGGYRKEGYRAYTNSPEFKKGLIKLEQLATQKRVAIVCAEKFPWKCHRRFIAEELKSKFTIVHIIEANKTWIPKEQ